MIFAQTFFEFGLQEGMLTIVRAIAAIGGAVAGWFVSDLLTRLIYRISFRGATPVALLLLTKLGGAATTAALIWFFMPLGGGGGGLGWGPGQGGGPGKGPGDGSGKGKGNGEIVKDAKTEKTTKDDKKTAVSPAKLESIDIEIIDDKRYKDDGKERVFLVKRAMPALSESELDDYLKTNHAKIEVTPVLTKNSIGIGRDDNPLNKLLNLTRRYGVKTLQTKTP